MTSPAKTMDLDQSDPVPLDPVILRARDELLEKYSDKSFEEQITFYKAVIEGETDGVQRLSAMAARVYVLRKRLALLAGNVMEDQLNDLSNKQLGFDIDGSITESTDIKDSEAIGGDNTWMRLRIVDSSEVNGVRFPSGVVIDVKREDGEKLIESGKAEFISTEESRQFSSEEGIEGLKSQVKAEDISEEGAAEELEDVSKEGAAEEVEASDVAEEGASEEAEVEDVSKEGTAEEVEASDVAEEGASEEAEAEAVAEEGVAEEVEASDVAKEGASEEVEAEAVPKNEKI